MKRILLGFVMISLILLSQAASHAQITQLFISEYIEGGSNNKAIEIYNGTGSDILLAGTYSLRLYFNGATTYTTINLTGTALNGDVYVIANSSAIAGITAQADQLTSSLTFNGNDVVALYNGTSNIDIIGQIGFNPGTEWGTGLTSTADNTIIRKPTIYQGDSNGSDAFDPSIEWDGYATDYYANLGMHTVNLATEDFGDAPDPTIGPYLYPTTLVTHGDPARHTVFPGVFLGLTVDKEADGFPSINADGDDNNATDDEDGVSWSSLVLGSTGTLTVTPSVNGYVSAWIDFNGDGDWQDSGEQIYSDAPVTAPGPFTLAPAFPIPGTATLGTTYLRVRYYVAPQVPCNQDHGLCPEGGEVEDYTVMIEDVMTEYDFGDAPDQTIGPNFFYPTTLVTHGNPARHVITSPPMFMGMVPATDIDPELDGQPHPIALGDDLALPDDENGANFLLPLQAGSNGTLQVQMAPMNPNPGFVSAWVDFNADGDWADSGEQICIDSGPYPPGMMAIITFPIPYTSTFGPTFARVRLTSTAGNTNCNATTGLCPDGEVEDHWVEIIAPAPITLVINEIDFDDDEGDDREFVEIYNYGASTVNLDNVDLVLVNGNPPTAPFIYQTFQLSSVSLAPNDYWVVCGNAANVANCDQDVAPDTNLIQNGDSNIPPANGDAAALVVHGTSTIIDTVGYVFPVTGWTEGAGFAPDDPATVPPPDYSINRCPDGIDTNDNAADFFVREISPGLANPCTVTDPTGCAATFTTICEGDSTDLSATSVYEVHWFDDVCGGNEVGIGSPLTVSPLTTTTYHAQALDVLSGTWSAGCCSITVNVNALPVMTCPGDFSVTIDTAAFTLSGATPPGGSYSGDGVSGGMFDPAVANLGPHVITYTYIDANTCTNTCTFTITVTEPATATPEPTATPTGPTPTPTDTPTAGPIPATGPAGIGLLLLALGSLMSFAGVRRKK